MNVQEDYDAWARTYDAGQNRTRDLEQIALGNALGPRSFQACLEAGCGTGKNTARLLGQCAQVVSVDFSKGMLEVARAKVKSPHVSFRQADLTGPWDLPENHFDLIIFSLVLEHISNLTHVFAEAAKVLAPGGWVYVGELHPFKQYLGSKARFETDTGARILTCHTHHISEFCDAALAEGLSVVRITEYFDEEVDKPPRILAMLFEKKRPRD